MLLSIVVPCFNEEETLMRMYLALIEEINSNRVFDRYEMIFVDDGSRDNTLGIMKELRNRDKCVRFVSFSRNFGKEAAIYAGLKASLGDLVVLMDADLQHPPKILHEMVNKIISDNYDSVGAVRCDRHGESVLRSFLSRCFYRLINAMSDTEIRKNATDYRMMTRQFVDSVLALSEVNRFTKGIFSWVGYRCTDIEYENVDRECGDSKWSFRSLFKYSIEGIVAFSTTPLMISSFLGIISFLGAFLMLFIFFMKTIIFGETVEGFPTIVCSIFLLGGIQLLTIGILGQYLSRTYLEVKNRPIYIEKERSE